MTKLLDDVFTLARQLAADEQHEIARPNVADLTEDDAFDRRIATTAHKLDRLIDEALEEDDAGQTQEWMPLPR